MAHKIHKLQLHKPITVSTDEATSDGTFAILSFTSEVGPKDLEPLPESHLVGGEKIDSIVPGFYLFTQGTCPLLPTEDPFTASLHEQYRTAAEAVWLESLWREEPCANNRVIIRLLQEDGKTAFQIFRKTTKEHM